MRSMISGIVNDLIKFKEQKMELEKSVKDINSKIDKAEDKYNKIIAGDWSVLNDNMLKGQPSSEK